ncbi:MAG TPA: selenocysteine-specific translation elongation factor [Gemmatimonadaceae bacterium]
MILGTAGHIDHGKTALIRSLTGVDTDRLPEEKRRGITIELGFAPLELDGIGTVGVVDVPGHEAFVRTMLAGATGVDIALLVVAADEGVMPQTREHLAILTLLGIRGGVVALSKTDLVDDDWLALVTEEVRELLPGSALEGAEIVPVSVHDARSLDRLRAAIGAAAARGVEPLSADLFRMPIDRAFSLRGTGTVVTGTVWSGTLEKGAAWVHPPGRAVRVRELHSHGRAVGSVGRGMRAAVALADVTVDAVTKGGVLVGPDGWSPSDTLRATLRLLDRQQPSLGARTRVRLHLGSTDVGARIVPLAPGMVRIHLETAIVCRAGDRFIIRGGPQVTTLGGGIVLDPYSRRRARALPTGDHSPQPMLHAFCMEAGPAGVGIATLPIRLGIPRGSVAEVLASAHLVHTRERVYLSDVAAGAKARLLSAVGREHARDSLSPGLSLEEARTAAGVPRDLFDLVLDGEIRSGSLAVSGAFVHRHGWVPTLSDEQDRLSGQMMHAFCSADEPIAVGDVNASFGPDSGAVLRHLEQQGRVIRLGDALVAAEPVVRRMVEQLRAGMQSGRGYSPAELRDSLGISRKILIPLLEYCDRVQVTERRGSERVLRVDNGVETFRALNTSK